VIFLSSGRPPSQAVGSESSAFEMQMMWKRKFSASRITGREDLPYGD